jgi:predicted metalloprotease with PDZ domain
MKTFEIGPYSWSDPVIVLSQAATGGLASEDYAGNIGNHVLERFKCTFDYEHRAVYLEPGKRYRERDRFSRVGIQIAKFGDRFEAMQVLAGSPAARAGLQVRDRVTAIDGRPVASYDPEELRVMFEDGAPGTKHTLEVERGGKKKKLKLALAELL